MKDNGHKYFLSVLADPYMPVRFLSVYSKIDFLLFYFIQIKHVTEIYKYI